MTDSILNSVKKVLGVSEDDTSFDTDIIMHINSTFATLQQLGIGPDEGYVIEDEDTEWSDYLDDELRYNQVKTYICLKVRLVFDPPVTSFALDAMKQQILEFEWRINVAREIILSDEAS